MDIEIKIKELEVEKKEYSEEFQKFLQNDPDASNILKETQNDSIKLLQQDQFIFSGKVKASRRRLQLDYGSYN